MNSQTENTTSANEPITTDTHKKASVGKTKMETINALQALRGLMTFSQLGALGEAMRGEEKQFFFDKICEMADTFNTMPKTYEQGGKGQEAIAYLHYFTSDCDWYITEKDMEPEQLQAFGLAKIWEREIGYISIVELVACGAELDLYFTPTALKDIK